MDLIIQALLGVLSPLFAVWVIWGNPKAIIQPNKYGVWPITLFGIAVVAVVVAGFMGVNFGTLIAAQLFLN